MSEEPIIHLRSIRGVGPSAESKIEACGIKTTNELAAITIAEFKMRCPILHRKAAGFIKSAKTLVRKARTEAGLPPPSWTSPEVQLEANEQREEKASVLDVTNEPPVSSVSPEELKEQEMMEDKKTQSKKKSDKKKGKKEKKSKKEKDKKEAGKETKKKKKDKPNKDKKSKGGKKSKAS